MTVRFSFSDVVKRAFLHAAVAMALLFISPALAHAQSLESAMDDFAAGNFSSAERQWESLAEDGNADALFNLGRMYQLGKGEDKDLGRAMELFTRAAENGHTLAKRELANILAFDLGDSNSRQEALALFQQAAREGDGYAQYILGLFRFNGDFLSQDLTMAYAWTLLALEVGVDAAVQSELLMRPLLDENQIEAAFDLSRTLMTDFPKAAHYSLLVGESTGRQRPAGTRMVRAEPVEDIAGTGEPPALEEKEADPVPPKSGPEETLVAAAEVVQEPEEKLNLAKAEEAGSPVEVLNEDPGEEEAESPPQKEELDLAESRVAGLDEETLRKAEKEAEAETPALPEAQDPAPAERETPSEKEMVETPASGEDADLNAEDLEEETEPDLTESLPAEETPLDPASDTPVEEPVNEPAGEESQPETETGENESQNASSPATRDLGDPDSPLVSAEPFTEWSIQLASFRTPENAEAEWQDLITRVPDLLENLEHRVLRFDVGPDLGVRYRLRAGPFPKKEDADFLCQSLTEAGIGCLVIWP